MKRQSHQKSAITNSQALRLTGFAGFGLLLLLALLAASFPTSERSDRQLDTGTMTEVLPGREAASIGLPPQAVQPLGTRPAHLSTDPVSIVPNQQAITQALWAPGIDLGYVPQGLTFAEGQLLISAYKSTSPVISMGACRVYRIDPDTGKLTGYFDLPPECGHAGGLGYAGDGILILSDTRRLYRINLEQAIKDQNTTNAITGTLDLGGALRGSFAAFVPASAWSQLQPGDMPATGFENGPGMLIGTWSTSARKASAYILPLSLFDRHNGTLITENNAVHSLELKARAQGGSFAPDGSLWFSYSSHDFGRVEQTTVAGDTVKARYELVSGTEDISFDDQGNLWAVSEAGSLRWRSWRTSFPVVFKLDITLLN